MCELFASSAGLLKGSRKLEDALLLTTRCRGRF